MRKNYLILFGILLLSLPVFAQDSTSFFEKAFHFPDKLFSAIDKHAAGYQQKLERQTQRYLQKLARQEKRIKQKLWRKDSTLAQKLFSDTDSLYTQLGQQVTNPASLVNNKNQAYDSHLDTMQTALRFLQQQQFIQPGSTAASNIKNSLGNYDQLQQKLNGTDQVQKYLQQRQHFLQQQLQSTGLVKQLNTYKQQLYYYCEQLNEYKNAFKDPGKLENLLLQALNKLPAFRKFFNSHSQLASLFRLPGNEELNGAIAGLQSRSQLQQDLQQRLGSGPNASQLMQQQVNEGQNTLNQLRNTFNRSGGNTTDMPGFRPNTQKTKSFLNRLEWGTNMQSVKPNGYFPATTDLGLSLGYKLNDKSIAGIGGSYKLGLGNSFRDIRISHQGMGLRSFIDIKLKGSFWISGGGEMNYRPSLTDTLTASSSSDPGIEGARWQRSALLGISKKYQIGKKWKGNLQLFYDFLYQQQVPRTQPVVFRMGYSFK